MNSKPFSFGKPPVMLPCSLSPSSLIALTKKTSSSHSPRLAPRLFASCSDILMFVLLTVWPWSCCPLDRISVTLYPVTGYSGHENTGSHCMIRVSSITFIVGLGGGGGPLVNNNKINDYIRRAKLVGNSPITIITFQLLSNWRVALHLTLVLFMLSVAVAFMVWYNKLFIL